MVKNKRLLFGAVLMILVGQLPGANMDPQVAGGLVLLWIWFSKC